MAELKWKSSRPDHRWSRATLCGTAAPILGISPMTSLCSSCLRSPCPSPGCVGCLGEGGCRGRGRVRARNGVSMPRLMLSCHIGLEFRRSTQQTRLACLQGNESSTTRHDPQSETIPIPSFEMQVALPLGAAAGTGACPDPVARSRRLVVSSSHPPRKTDPCQKRTQPTLVTASRQHADPRKTHRIPKNDPTSQAA